MSKTLLLLSLLSFNLPAIELQGELSQGGMLRGITLKDSQVSLDGNKIMVTETGNFVFGFGRDAKQTATLKIIAADGKVEIISLKIKQRKYNVQKINGLPAAKVTPRTEQQLAHIKKDNLLVKNARKIKSQQQGFTEQFIWPAAGKISGVYGSQRVLNGQPRRPHFGLDVANVIGSTIVAPADGTVVMAESDMYFSGGTLILDHGGGIFSSFLHLSKLNKVVGEPVSQGEKIAEMGATGRVTGPHLDWRINWFNVRLDPAFLVSEKPPEKLNLLKVKIND